MKRPRDVADRSRELRDLRRLDRDGFLRETFTLPLEDARAKAREFLNAFPTGGYMNRRKVAPASRRQNRVHNAAAAHRGLTGSDHCGGRNESRGFDLI